MHLRPTRLRPTDLKQTPRQQTPRQQTARQRAPRRQEPLSRDRPRSRTRTRACARIRRTTEPVRLRLLVAAQDPGVRVRQLAAGVDAQLVREEPPGAVEPVQRLRLAPRAVQRRHQGRGEGLPHRMGHGLVPEHRRRPVVLAQLCVGVRQLLDRREPGLLQRLRGGLERCAGVGAGQRGPLPQRQGLPQHQHAVGRTALLPGQHQEFLEPLGVQQGLRHPQHVRVPERGQLDPVRLRVRAGQQGAQPGHMPLDDRTGVQRRGVVPQGARQPGHGNGGVGAQQERGEQAAAFGGAEWQRTRQRVDADGAQQPELHERLPFRV